MELLPNPNSGEDPLVRRRDVAAVLSGVSERTLERWFDQDEIIRVGRDACVSVSTAVRVCDERGYSLDVNELMTDVADDQSAAPVLSLPGRPVSDQTTSRTQLRGLPSASEALDQLSELVQSEAERAAAAEEEAARLRNQITELKVRLARHGLLDDDERG